MKITEKVLLIWPPIVDRFDLPLGISSLVAYIKNRNMCDVHVSDINLAYLKKIKSYWLVYLLKRFCKIFVLCILENYKRIRNSPIKYTCTTDKDKTVSHNIKGRDKITLCLKQIDEKLSIFLRKCIQSHNEKVPWSLKSILEAYSRDPYPYETKRIRSILNPIIRNGKFSLIGISANYPEQLFFALLIAREIKNIDRNIRLVMGGTQVTKHINYLTGSNNLRGFINFFVTNDGEEPLLTLLGNSLYKDLPNVPNLYFSTQSGYVKSGVSYHLEPKDFACPDFKGFDMNYYEDCFPVLASKGCWWSKCNFCTYPNLSNHIYRINTVGNTLNIIKQLKAKHKVTKLKFLDDALPPSFMKQLAEGFIQNKENIDWSTNIILMKEFANPDFCKLLKRSGLTHVIIGLESLSIRILTLMNKFHKDMNESEIMEILCALKNSGITILLHIIFGFPTETLGEARQTLDFLIRNSALYDGCIIHPFSLEDDTPVINNPEMFKITKVYRFDKDYGERLGYRFEVSCGMSQEEARKFTYGEARKSLELKRRFLTIAPQASYVLSRA